MSSSFFSKLFIGKKVSTKPPKNPYVKLQEKLNDVWENRYYNDFGIERLIKIFLILFGFIMPGTLVKFLVGSTDLVVRKLFLELFVLFKVCWFIIIFKWDIPISLPLMVFSIILSVDSLYFSVSKIFIEDVINKSISYKRSLILNLLNFLEITFCFALIYAYIDRLPANINHDVFAPQGHLTDLQLFYFSLITAATVGYGDFYPIDETVKMVVIMQILVSLFFIVIFISNTINNLDNDTFFNTKRKKGKQEEHHE